ncbi:MAG: hypothetical protein M0C28_20960 [Candidatus Moduliflexus flocculans]|nr:hypothetical protein [Candidatus Moduliflexus flocculans]
MINDVLAPLVVKGLGLPHELGVTLVFGFLRKELSLDHDAPGARRRLPEPHDGHQPGADRRLHRLHQLLHPLPVHVRHHVEGDREEVGLPVGGAERRRRPGPELGRPPRSLDTRSQCRASMPPAVL